MSDDGDLVPVDGRLLRRWRRRAGMTQAALAEATGFDQTYVSKVETAAVRRVAPDRLARLAEAVGAAPAALVASGSEAIGPGDSSQSGRKGGIERADAAEGYRLAQAVAWALATGRASAEQLAYLRRFAAEVEAWLAAGVGGQGEPTGGGAPGAGDPA